jgi:hypothetical protein
MKDLPGLFVCGYPKSGTTLLTLLLDGHKEILLYPEEIKYFATVKPKILLHDKRLNLLNNSGANRPTCGVQNYQSGKRDYSFIDPTKYIERLESLVSQAKSDKELFYAIYENWADFQKNPVNIDEVKYISEKTPKNEFNYLTLKKWFPDSKFIHIVRDPRDNFLSYSKKFPKMTLLNFVEIWKRSTKHGLAYSKNSPNDYLLVHYEDLVANTSETMEKISSFLSIEFSELLTHPTRNNDAWEGNSMFGDNSTSVHNKALSRWKKHLPQRDTLMLESYLFNEMNALGYAPKYAASSTKLPLFYQVKRKLREFFFPTFFRPEEAVIRGLRDRYRWTYFGFLYRYIKSFGKSKSI